MGVVAVYGLGGVAEDHQIIHVQIVKQVDGAVLNVVFDKERVEFAAVAVCGRGSQEAHEFGAPIGRRVFGGEGEAGDFFCQHGELLFAQVVACKKSICG